MAIRFIDKSSGATTTTAITNSSSDRQTVRNLPDAAGIAYDKVDNNLKVNGNDTIQFIGGANGLFDSANFAKVLPNSAAKTIVDGSATALFSVACPALSGIGGAGFFLVRASDGTEFQADAGMFTYSGEAKTTTVVATITYVTGNEAKAVSSGTLTLAFTADVSVANVVTYKLQPTGSLTESAPYTIEYTLFPIRGAVTIL